MEKRNTMCGNIRTLLDDRKEITTPSGISLILKNFNENLFKKNSAKSILKVQSCKLHNNKYMIASTQIRDTENFAYIAVLVFKSFSHKVLFINKKNKRNC